MDMSAEGFGCLYLPSVAPQATNVAGNLDGTIIGGIGSGEFLFLFVFSALCFLCLWLNFPRRKKKITLGNGACQMG